MFDDATVHTGPFIPILVKVHLLVQDSSVHYLQYFMLEWVWKSRCLTVSARCRVLRVFIHPCSYEMGTTTSEWYIYLYDQMMVLVKMLGVYYIFCEFELIIYKSVIKVCKMIFLQSGASVDKTSYRTEMLIKLHMSMLKRQYKATILDFYLWHHNRFHLFLSFGQNIWKCGSHTSLHTTHCSEGVSNSSLCWGITDSPSILCIRVHEGFSLKTLDEIFTKSRTPGYINKSEIVPKILFYQFSV